jgi:hypothetical protein
MSDRIGTPFNTTGTATQVAEGGGLHGKRAVHNLPA